MDKRIRRNEEGRQRQTGEMRELEMGGERKSWAFFPLLSLVFCKSSSRKIRLKGPSGCCGTIHSVSPPPLCSLPPLSTPSRYCLSLCLMAELRFRAMPLVIRLISGGVGLLTSLVQDSSPPPPTHTHSLQRAKKKTAGSNCPTFTQEQTLFFLFCLMFKNRRPFIDVREGYLME